MHLLISYSALWDVLWFANTTQEWAHNGFITTPHIVITRLLNQIFAFQPLATKTALATSSRLNKHLPSMGLDISHLMHTSHYEYGSLWGHEVRYLDHDLHATSLTRRSQIRLWSMFLWCPPSPP